MNIGTWQVGIATQLGLLLVVMGLLCVAKPYQTAQWHKNDPDIQEREHKREQSHRRKKDRVEFDASILETEREPSNLAVRAVRVLGAIALVAGAALMLWSFL